MSDASNPYESTAAKPLKPSETMEYMRSFHYVFENPNWITNLLFVGLCKLSANVIPIIGQLVFAGYQFEIIEALHRRPGSQYPDFDMNKLLDYLVRGFWVFLVKLVIGLVMSPVLGGLALVFVVLFISAGAAGGEDGAAIAMVILVPIVLCVGLAMLAVINVLAVPFTLRAGLTQDFGAAFDFGFAKQFFSKHLEGDDSLRFVYNGCSDALPGRRWCDALRGHLFYDEYRRADAGSPHSTTVRTSPYSRWRCNPHEAITSIVWSLTCSASLRSRYNQLELFRCKSPS